MKPDYYKALWHNCNKCRIHFMSEFPHATAYLCDECFNSMPHYRTKVKKQQQVKKGPTYAWLDTDWPLSYIIAYIWGCSMCLLVIAYYLFEKWEIPIYVVKYVGHRPSLLIMKERVGVWGVFPTVIDTVCLCHRCHKEMAIGQISPFMEWHICEKCMEKK